MIYLWGKENAYPDKGFISARTKETFMAQGLTILFSGKLITSYIQLYYLPNAVYITFQL